MKVMSAFLPFIVARSAICHFPRSRRNPHNGPAGLPIFILRLPPEISSEIRHAVTLASASDPMTRRNAAVQTGGQAAKHLHKIQAQNPDYLLAFWPDLKTTV